jgi:hypothetical protein
MVHASQLREIVRAFSPPDPAPVLTSVKVVRPAGRSTLTPAAAGGPSQHEKPATEPPHNWGSGPPAPLTRPDPMGAVRCSACDRLGPGSHAPAVPGSRDPCRPGRSWTDRGGRPAAGRDESAARARRAEGSGRDLRCLEGRVERRQTAPRTQATAPGGWHDGRAGRTSRTRALDLERSATPAQSQGRDDHQRDSTWKRATRSLAPC